LALNAGVGPPAALERLAPSTSRRRPGCRAPAVGKDPPRARRDAASTPP
jgi:hypothetical protein